MEFLRVPPEEAAVRRYTEALWLPYQHALEAAVDDFALATDVDVMESEVPFRLDKLADDDYELLVAVDPANDGAQPTSILDVDGEFVGFIATEVDEAPDVFERPDRLMVGELYVVEAYRGSGLADELMAQAVERARAEGCDEVTLNVDVSNQRAMAYYEKVGFEPIRRQLLVDADDLASRVCETGSTAGGDGNE